MELKNSLYDLFRQSAETFATNPFLAVPRRLAQVWDIPNEIQYGEALERVDALRGEYSVQGIGEGDRVALAFESRPEFVFHYLALNGLGVFAPIES